MVLIVDGGPTTVLLLLASNLVRSREKWGSRDLSTSLDSAKLVWNVHQQQRQQQQQQQHWGSFFFMWWRKWTRYCAFFCKEKNMMINCTGFRCYVQVCMLFQLTLSHWNWRSYCIWKPFQVSWLCEFRFMSFDSNSLNLSTENSFSDIQISKVVWLALSRSDNSFWNFCRFIFFNSVYSFL